MSDGRLVIRSYRRVFRVEQPLLAVVAQNGVLVLQPGRRARGTAEAHRHSPGVVGVEVEPFRCMLNIDRAAAGDDREHRTEDAREAIGHGLKAKRSKSGAISFDLTEAADAPLQ